MLEKLFNIKHKNAEAMIKIPEDWGFLKDQEGDWKFTMMGVDKELTRKDDRTFGWKAEEIL